MIIHRPDPLKGGVDEFSGDFLVSEVSVAG